MNRLFEDTFASAPRRSHSGTFRPPRRLRSSASIDGPLDNIGEDLPFEPTKPRRYKSSEELDAALLSWDTEEDALQDHMVSSVCSDMEADELDIMMEELSLTGEAQHRRPSNLMNTDSFCSNCSFYSIGSSMTAAQELQPGRFITPMNSFSMSLDNTNVAPITAAIWDVGAVRQNGRATVDPMKLLTADVSFRLPLVRKDSFQPKQRDCFIVKKNVSASPVDEKPLKKRTIQLDFGGIPSLPFEDDTNTTPVPPVDPIDTTPTIHSCVDPVSDDEPSSPIQARTEEPPARPPPPKFGLKRKSSIYRGLTGK